MAWNLTASMAEVARLTRAGRLADATALLQGRLLPDATPQQKPAPSSGVADATTAGPGADRPVLPGPERDPAEHREAPIGTGVSSVVGALLERFGTGQGFGYETTGRATRRAAPPLPAGARFEERSYVGEAGARLYKVYVPSSYVGQPVPLVVMLHGCKQSPDDFAIGTRMNEIAEEQGFVVAYPGQPSSANPSRCWNWFNVGDQTRSRGEPSLIAGITRTIMRDLSIDPARVYVAGLSAGGAAAAIMGSTYPDLYAAVGVHSGLACGAARDLPSALTAMRQGGARATETAAAPMPTIVFHGDRDATVNPVNGNQVIAQSRAGTVFVTTAARGRSPGGVAFTRTVEADGHGRPMLEQWVLHGAGHAWSGGSPAGSYTDPRGPDASREMVRFFASHCRAGD